MVSWQIAVVGDPLYNPFKVHPALATDALPPALQKAINPPIGTPAPQPQAR